MARSSSNALTDTGRALARIGTTTAPNVTFLSTEPPDLGPNTRFRWKTFGAMVTSRVIVFDPPHELGWDAHGLLSAYYGWIIEPEGSECRVVTEETQKGIIPKLAWWYLRPMLERGHQKLGRKPEEKGRIRQPVTPSIHERTPDQPSPWGEGGASSRRMRGTNGSTCFRW